MTTASRACGKCPPAVTSIGVSQHEEGVGAVAFSPDGALALTASADQTAAVVGDLRAAANFTFSAIELSSDGPSSARTAAWH